MKCAGTIFLTNVNQEKHAHIHTHNTQKLLFENNDKCSETLRNATILKSGGQDVIYSGMRTAFVSFCQGNRKQLPTARQAAVILNYIAFFF